MEKEDLEVSESPLEDGQITEKDLDNAVVASKYRGTEADKRDMRVLGKKQVLRVCLSVINRQSSIRNASFFVLRYY